MTTLTLSLRKPAPASPWPARLGAAAATLAALYAVQVVHATGQTLLALTLLVISALAVWTYSSARTKALRYLFPGIATALVFVIFPMLYTMGMSFTNHSSRNLLEPERARAQLLETTLVTPGSQRGYSLHAAGAPAGTLRLHLDAGDTPGATPLVTAPFTLDADAPRAQTLTLAAAPADAPPAGAALPMAERVRLLPALRELQLRLPDGSPLSLASLREFAQLPPLYEAQTDGSLMDRLTRTVYRADMTEGYYTSAEGEHLQPGFRVGVGLRHYLQIFSEGKFREPFASVFVWTVVFSGVTVISTCALGLLLAVLLEWPLLRGRAAYRLVLFLPYAVPGFISILVFKGLFNQNLGEINLILNGLFGIRPAWFSDPLLAKLMLLIVNLWLGFPYMMVLCTGLIKSIPADLYEASAVAGARPWTNFSRITLPLILQPLTPLLISAFAFNFNNFVLISLLTGGRPDVIDATLPAGTTDILVSYTWRIAFQDSGQQFGLAAAISTVIFLIVAAITLIQLRFTAKAETAKAH